METPESFVPKAGGAAREHPQGDHLVIRYRTHGINRTANCGIWHDESFQIFKGTRGELFKEMREEWGRCVSFMYQDRKDQAPEKTGWVFEKRDHYSDAPTETYMREVWVEVIESEVAQQTGRLPRVSDQELLQEMRHRGLY